MDSFSGLEGFLKFLFAAFIFIIPIAVFGLGVFVGWLIWG